MQMLVQKKKTASIKEFDALPDLVSDCQGISILFKMLS